VTKYVKYTTFNCSCLIYCFFSVTERKKINDKEKICNSQLFMDNHALPRVIYAKGYVTGITVLDRELYVVRYRSSKVDVYNTNNFTRTRKISITGSSSLWAIVASARDNCLYINDDVLKVIYRYNLLNKVITKWSVGGLCYGLSLTGTYNSL